MIDHIGYTVSDLARSRCFYEAALKPIGIAQLMEVGPELTGSGGTAIGYGRDGKPFFWIGDDAAPGKGTHIAFAVESRALVDAFYAAAIAAGGRDNGGPGLRPHYHPDYYAAFVFDPDGGECRGGLPPGGVKMVCTLSPVRAEPVEALPSFFDSRDQKREGFDRLSPNGRRRPEDENLHDRL